MEYLACIIGEDLVGKNMTDMLKEANGVSFLFGKACRITRVVIGGISRVLKVDFVVEFKEHEDTCVWNLAGETLEWCFPV
jgi:hypothetical protein